MYVRCMLRENDSVKLNKVFNVNNEICGLQYIFVKFYSISVSKYCI